MTQMTQDAADVATAMMTVRWGVPNVVLFRSTPRVYSHSFYISISVIPLGVSLFISARLRHVEMSSSADPHHFDPAAGLAQLYPGAVVTVLGVMRPARPGSIVSNRASFK